MQLSSVLASLVIGTVTAAWASSSGCLCTYGDPCWPPASVFAQLQSQISQPLIYPRPTASPCYPPSDPSGNCSAVRANWTDGPWRSSIPGSMEEINREAFVFPNGTVDACYLNTTITGTCGQGSVPVIGVDARTVSDIQAAVTFAVQNSLKLVVKNTGHDYLGRSNARGAFMIWTHNMKNITYNSAFVPQGATDGETYEAITVDAGVQWHEAYAIANNNGRAVVGGTDRSVGTSGGWLAGGGHSMLAPSYGLGVDNALEISVVLSTGEFLTVNNYQHPDLFWALRGGGGSTYGVVTSVTYRTHPSTPTQVYVYYANAPNSTVLAELVGQFLHYQTQFTDAGWGGFGSVSDRQLFFFYVAPNMTNETAVASTASWRNYTRSLAPLGVVSTEQAYQAPSWYEVYQSAVLSNLDNGINNVIFNRLLSRDSVANKYAQLGEVLVDCNGGVLTVAGGRVSQFDPDSAGLNPAWRDAVVETWCYTTWEDGLPETEIQELISQLQGRMQTVNDLTPADGSYFNEVSLLEANWQQTYFGAHYSTLREIKERYDPNRLFVVAQGVGSEEWNADLTCR